MTIWGTAAQAPSNPRPSVSRAMASPRQLGRAPDVRPRCGKAAGGIGARPASENLGKGAMPKELADLEFLRARADRSASGCLICLYAGALYKCKRIGVMADERCVQFVCKRM